VKKDHQGTKIYTASLQENASELEKSTIYWKLKNKYNLGIKMRMKLGEKKRLI
jgi:hypothetical protein